MCGDGKEAYREQGFYGCCETPLDLIASLIVIPVIIIFGFLVSMNIQNACSPRRFMKYRRFALRKRGKKDV